MRVAVAGYPRAGKTTSYPDALHTDDVMDAGRERAAQLVAAWFDSPDRNLCVEGVRVPHALREIRAAGKPCPIDKLVFFAAPHVQLSPRQRSLGEEQQRIVRELGDWIPRVEWR
jgi:hypothetical protein